MFVIKANTPEAMRDQIVKWLELQASNHRIAARKINTIHRSELQLAKANAYEDAAKFLASCTVESDILCDHDGTLLSQCKSEACKSHGRCCWQ